jgi:hypothetical protein
VTDGNCGLLVIGLSGVFNVSVSPFTEAQVAAADHTFQLDEAENNEYSSVLHVDWAHMGVGGDDSWSGLTVLEPYRVPVQHVWRFKLLLVPFIVELGSPLEATLMALAKRALVPFRSTNRNM